jgi:hypothetical protein
MSTRTIRVKVRGGHLEPLDDLALPEGSETTIVVEIPERESVLKRRAASLQPHAATCFAGRCRQRDGLNDQAGGCLVSGAASTVSIEVVAIAAASEFCR